MIQENNQFSKNDLNIKVKLFSNNNPEINNLKSSNIQKKTVKHFEVLIINSKINENINKEKIKTDRNITNNINIETSQNKQNEKIKLEKENNIQQHNNSQNILELNKKDKNQNIIIEKNVNQIENNNNGKKENIENNNRFIKENIENNYQKKNKKIDNNSIKKENIKINNQENSENIVININNINKIKNMEKKEKKIANISLQTINLWKDILYIKKSKEISFTNYLVNENDKIENKKIILKDVLRTRGKESSEFPDYQNNLQFLINCYCDYNNIKYKQGLNEIIGALLFLKYKLDISLEDIFQLSQGIINKFVLNYYYEKTIFSLKSSLSLLNLLLKYHKPEIYNLFDKLMILPEMYATNWFLTIFSSKLDLELTYYFWNFLIGLDDKLLMHYFAVAFLIFNEDKFLKEDKINIPFIITKLTINNIDEMGKIFQIAIELRKQTPYSFRILANKLEIFKYHSDEIENCYEKYKPNSLIAMPIFPSEIFYICYNGIIKCPDDLCCNYIESNNNKYESKHHICEHCNMKINKNIKYILLDLRILEYGTFEDENEKTGFLPKMIMVEQNELKSDDFTEKITERFLGDKGNYHFIFMTSKTNYFESFEDDYYIEKKNINKYKAKEIKVEKEINETLISKISKRKQFKLKEYDNLKKLLISLLNCNYPYISFCYGGFNEIHQLISKFDINLLNHDPKCNLCKKKKSINNSLNINSPLLIINDVKNNDKKDDKNKKIEFKFKYIEKIPLNDINEMVKKFNYQLIDCFVKKVNENILNKNNQCIILMKKIDFLILNYLNNNLDLGLIDDVNIHDIINIKKKKTIIKLIINNSHYQNLKIYFDFKKENQAINFLDSYELRKKFYHKNNK